MVLVTTGANGEEGEKARNPATSPISRSTRPTTTLGQTLTGRACSSNTVPGPRSSLFVSCDRPLGGTAAAMSTPVTSTICTVMLS